MGHKIKIAPSIILTTSLAKQASEAVAAGADYIHVDVMDGRFVTNTTLGADALAGLCASIRLPVEVHLMLRDPEYSILQFVKAGASILTVHVEVCTQLYQTVHQIKELGVMAGAAIKPETPIDVLQGVLPNLDLVLVCSTNPGWGGQTFMESILGKIVQMRNLIDKQCLTTELAVDGGITAHVAQRAILAGARVLVAGTSIFHSGESVACALGRLRRSIKDVGVFE